MNINGFPSQGMSLMHSSQNVLMQSPVGEESVELQQSSLKPVEQAGKSEASRPSTTGREQEKEQRELKQKEFVEQKRVEQEMIKELSARDREVRNHERAHAAVGGEYAGAPRYEFQRGPDGINYAIGGEVSINTSPVSGDPKMTIEKAQVIKRAALAPAEPSAQDRAVAAEAVQLESQARIDLSKMEQEQRLQEQEMQAENRAVNEDKKAVVEANNNSSSDLNVDSVDDMNKTQESVFNEINNNLAAQLVSLGGSSQTPQSLGSIINRIV